MAIHSLDRTKAPLKLQIAALNTCVELRALFPPEALATALQQLVTRRGPAGSAPAAVLDLLSGMSCLWARHALYRRCAAHAGRRCRCSSCAS